MLIRISILACIAFGVNIYQYFYTLLCLQLERTLSKDSEQMIPSLPENQTLKTYSTNACRVN